MTEWKDPETGESYNITSDYKLMTTGSVNLCDIATTTYSFVPPPQPVGFWVLYPNGGLHTSFAMYHRPTDEQIKNTEALLGWGWEDAK